MLVADAGFDVAGLGAGTLSLIVVDEFRTESDVVERTRLVVHVHQGRLPIRGTGQHSRGLADCLVGSVVGHVLRRERRASRGDDGLRRGVEQVRHVVHMLVVGFDRDVPLIVELVIVGAAVPLQVVVTILAGVDGIGDEADVVVAAVGGVADAQGNAWNRTRILRHGLAGIKRAWHRIRDRRTDMPWHGLGSRHQGGLEDPVLGCRQGRLNTGVGIVVEGVRHRVRRHVVVRRELGFDVRDRDVAPDPDHEAFHHLRDEHLAIGHRHVVAVVLVLVQELVAPQTERRGVAVVLAVDRRETEAPVDMVLLDRVGQPLDIEHGLVELDRVRIVGIRGRGVATSHGAGAEVAAGIDPAVDLDVGIVHPVADRGIAERRHQRTVDRTRPRHAEAGGAAIRPFGERIGWSGRRGARPVLAASGRSLRIGRRRFMAPFEPIVVDETGEEVGTEIGVEALVVLVGIAAVGARIRRLRCTAQTDRRQRSARQKKSFHCLAPTFVTGATGALTIPLTSL